MKPREDLESIYRTALRAVEPGDLLRERLGKLPPEGRLFVVGGGKASAAMAAVLEEYCLDRIEAGCVAVKTGHGLPLKKIQVIEAGHPFPDGNSEKAGETMAEIAAAAGEDDCVVALISGGASSLMVKPQGVTLQAYQEETRKLLGAGVPIEEINAVRGKMNALAKGGLARIAAPASVIGYILSDVVGNDLAVIGSGPTCVDEGRVQNIIIGDVALAVGFAVQGARRLGYQVKTLLEPFGGEASEFGVGFAEQLVQMAPGSALVGGGETTVTMLGEVAGKGGRCQEAALAAALEVSGREGIHLLFAGTDGTDGPTDAAGAYVSGESMGRGEGAEEKLAHHDSFHFFEPLGDLFRPGPTLTNVGDLAIGIRTKK